LSINSWGRLFTGKANYRKLTLALWFETKRRFTSKKNISPEASQFQENLRRLADRGVQMTFLCSESDPRLEDLRDTGGDGLKKLLREGRLSLEIIPRSDHTFSSLQDQERLMKVLLERIDAMSSVEEELGNAFQVPSTSELTGVFLPQV